MKSTSKTFFLLLPALFLVGKASAQQNLHLNEIQVIGSHNSYKKAIQPQLWKFLESRDTTGRLKSIEYAHIPMPEQLDMGLRNLEIDAFADSEGGRYARPKGLAPAPGDDPYDPSGKMGAPGFKIFHILDIDFRSQYYTLKECLTALKKWSDAHRDHTPIFITLEPKDGGPGYMGTTPEAFTPVLFDSLDISIRRNLGRDKLITPDGVRGNYPTLEKAVKAGNWPLLKDAKGKFLFILDNNSAKMEMYRKGHPSLKGRALFVNAPAGDPEAAAMILNDPEDPEIAKRVKEGYIIRTRADAGTKEARENDYSHFEAAKKSGAQIITTDYYLPSTFFDSPYKIQFKDGTYVRPNPIVGHKG